MRGAGAARGGRVRLLRFFVFACFHSRQISQTTTGCARENYMRSGLHLLARAGVSEIHARRTGLRNRALQTWNVSSNTQGRDHYFTRCRSSQHFDQSQSPR